MKRRAFVRLFGGAAIAWPLAATPQPAVKVSRVGFLTVEPLSFQAANLQAFREGLREHGYVEGKNLVLEAKSAEGKADRLKEVAIELARLKVDVIVAAGSTMTRMARNSTKDIPIVMAYAGDPVRAGFADSLARPGGRITGLASFSAVLGAKRLEILRDTLPGLSLAAVLWNPNAPEPATHFKDLQAAAGQLKLQLQSLEVRRSEDIDAAFAAAAKSRPGALLVVEDTVTTGAIPRVLQFAAAQRLPAIFYRRDRVEAGGLMSYGPSYPDLCRRAATYVDRILKGAKPADLPIEQPTKLELVINLKTAKALGLTIPRPVMMRADDTIN